MRKIDMQKVGHIAKEAGKVVACGVLVFASYLNAKGLREESGSYDKAFEAIMASSMFSADKCKAIKALKRGMSDEYYNSVLSIMNSTMFGAEKVNMIEYLSER